MDKSILVQYISLKAEIKDMENRIEEIKKQIKRMESKDTQVSDSVKGTRKDGTYGSIRITGYPYSFCEKMKKKLKKRQANLDASVLRLMEMVIDAEEFVDRLDDSPIRRILRLKHIDGKSWVQVAHRMNEIYPAEEKEYTADGCRMKAERFLQKI